MCGQRCAALSHRGEGVVTSTASISDFPKIVLDLFYGRDYRFPVPLRPKRCAGFVVGAGAGRDGPVASVGLSCDGAPIKCAFCKVVKGRRPADEVGGPRTQQCGDAKHSVKAPSAWGRWELQADKTVACGTQAFLRPRLLFAVCCSNRTRCHVPGKHMMPRAHPRGAAGAVKRPVFRTPLRGDEEDNRVARPARPGAGRNTGR